MSGKTQWNYNHKLKPMMGKGVLMVMVLVLLLLIVAAGGGSWYYIHKKNAEIEELRRQKIAEAQRKLDNIHSFYETAFSGMDVAEFLDLYQEILRSRYPLELTGYQEVSFGCDNGNCHFSYKPKADAIFNVQEKLFRGEKYVATFAPDTADYQNIPAGSKESPMLTSFRNHEKINLPTCSDVLNYLYSYNSLSAQPFKLDELPASSITADEESSPSNPDNQGLLTGKWSVTLEDNYFTVSAFWHSHLYADTFIIKSVEKKDNTLNLSGNILCKK